MISFESGSKSIQRRTATRFKSQFPPTHPTPSVHMQSILQVGISRPNTWDSLRAFIREKKKRKKEILKIVRYRSSTLLQKNNRIPESRTACEIYLHYRRYSKELLCMPGSFDSKNFFYFSCVVGSGGCAFNTYRQ